MKSKLLYAALLSSYALLNTHPSSLWAKERTASSSQPSLSRQADELSEIPSVETRPNALILVIQNDSLFEPTSADLTPQGEKTISRIGRILSSYPNQRIVIKSHTDHVGRDAVNEDLSEQRARRIEASLVAEGVTTEQTISIGLGERQPKVSRRDKSLQSKNQRVEIVIEPKKVYRPGTSDRNTS